MQFIRRALLVLFASALVVFSAPDDILPPHRAGVILLRFKDGLSADQQKAVLDRIGGSAIKHIGVNVTVVNVGDGRVVGALQSAKARGEILYAEPDYDFTKPDEIEKPGQHARNTSSQLLVQAQAQPQAQAQVQNLAAGALPNDTFIANVWAAQNNGQTVNGVTGTPGADEKSALAWRVTTGTDSVVVAVLDSGVQYTHPDLITNMWNNPQGVGGCPVGTHGYNVLTGSCDPMDDDGFWGGHGSLVAGTLGAVGNNMAGIAGVNWTTSIMAIKIMDSSGNAHTSDLISGMDWIVNAKQAGVNVRVVNDSVTTPGTPYSQALSDEIDLLTANDILFVTAAGNTAENNDTTARYPCSYNRPGEICVAGTDENDNLWNYSNYGVTTVQLAAPAADTFSTGRLSNYFFLDGTSFSSPAVAGAAALILSRGYLSVSNLKATMLANVDPLPSLTGLVATGGRLNVCNAVPGCASVASSQPANSIQPGITGIPQYGSIVGASTGQWFGAPTNYAYQWYRCDGGGANCVVIPGATSQTYALLASADVGNAVSVTVTASNVSGTGSAQSAPSAPVTSNTSAFAINSTVTDGQNLNGSVQWKVTPSGAINFAQFYVDGVLSQTVSSSPYEYNQTTTGLFDTSQLTNGTHVLGIRALSTDNRTYGFYGATVTVGGTAPQNTGLPVVSGSAVQGQTLSTSNGTWTNNPTTFSFRWNRCNTSGSNCVAISGATSSSYLIGSADVGSTLRSAVTASNGSGSNTAQSAPTATVTGPVSIATASLPAGQQNAPYSATLAATGGASPYTWTVISGSLPAGLSLNQSSGVISGTPTASGTSSFTIQVKDQNLQTASRALSITINPAGGGGITQIQSNSAEGSGVASVSAAFSTANTAGNLIIAFVRMSSATQTVSLADTKGNTYVEAIAQVQDRDGHQTHIFYAKNIAAGPDTVTANFSSTNNHSWLAIYEYSGLSTTSPLDKTAAAQGSSSTVSTGSTATTGSANELVFVGAGFNTPSFNGTVSAGSGYVLQLQDTSNSRAATESAVVSSAGSYAGTFSLSKTANWSAVLATFAPAGGPSLPAVTTATLPNGQQNVSYSATLAATGGVTPYTWTVISGSLPAGLSLNQASGVISGTPTTSGTSSFSVQVKDQNSQTASRALSIMINPGGGGGITQIQSNSAEGSGVPSVSASFSAANTAGNLIVAFVRMSSTAQTVSLVDTIGNTYVDAVSQMQNTDGHQIHIFYAKNIAAGPDTVTANFSSTNNHPWLAIYEFSGLSTTNPLDKTAAAQGSGSAVSTGSTASTLSANELVFAGAGFNTPSFTGTVSAGAGYVLGLQDTVNSRAATESTVVSSIGTYAGAFSLSTTANWSAVVATFKP